MRSALDHRRVDVEAPEQPAERGPHREHADRAGQRGGLGRRSRRQPTPGSSRPTPRSPRTTRSPASSRAPRGSRATSARTGARAAGAVDAQDDGAHLPRPRRRPRAPRSPSPRRRPAARSATSSRVRSGSSRCRRRARSVASGEKPTLAGSTACVVRRLDALLLGDRVDERAARRHAVDELQLLEHLGARRAPSRSPCARRPRSTPRASAMPAMNWVSIESSSRSACSRYGSLISRRDEALGGALVAADLRHLHGDAEAIPQAAEEQVLLRETEDRGAAAGRDVELLRRARDVVLEVRAEALDLEDQATGRRPLSRSARIASRSSCALAQPIWRSRIVISTWPMRSSRSALRRFESVPSSDWRSKPRSWPKSGASAPST